jgi:hypothetical protein
VSFCWGVGFWSLIGVYVQEKEDIRTTCNATIDSKFVVSAWMFDISFELDITIQCLSVQTSPRRLIDLVLLNTAISPTGIPRRKGISGPERSPSKREYEKGGNCLFYSHQANLSLKNPLPSLEEEIHPTVQCGDPSSRPTAVKPRPQFPTQNVK